MAHRKSDVLERAEYRSESPNPFFFLFFLINGSKTRRSRGKNASNRTQRVLSATTNGVDTCRTDGRAIIGNPIKPKKRNHTNQPPPNRCRSGLFSVHFRRCTVQKIKINIKITKVSEKISKTWKLGVERKVKSIDDNERKTK